ncbi:MAG: hypothetical protein KF914_01315 [Rhizobiaceae bacterium]|nr:hypothetical protein [Rhizobiaceae bacterium]
MRSFTLKAALAAILVSSSLAGAYAAQQNSVAIDRGAAQPNGEAWEDNPQPTDQLVTGSIAAPAKPVTQTRAAPGQAAPAYRPRLAHIVREVGRADHRIHSDHARGLLTRAEYRQFDARAAAIRADAMKTAGMHRGALPRGHYDSLQARLMQLDRDVRHAAIG